MSGEGAGIALDEVFDFTVDEGGDLRTTAGRAELQKDLAFQLAFSLDQYRGARPTNDLYASMKRTVRRVVEEDPRVASVDTQQLEVELAGDDRERINLQIPVTVVGDEQYELVFNGDQL